jgi:hypothetical protein
MLTYLSDKLHLKKVIGILTIFSVKAGAKIANGPVFNEEKASMFNTSLG